jgi:hypothetical protein
MATNIKEKPMLAVKKIGWIQVLIDDDTYQKRFKEIDKIWEQTPFWDELKIAGRIWNDGDQLQEYLIPDTVDNKQVQAVVDKLSKIVTA